MKNFIYLALLIIIVSCSSNDSSEEILNCGVYEGDISLYTPLLLEEFIKCNYTEITGDLTIGDGNVAYPIEDLSGLSSLTKVGGTLGIGNLNELQSLHGLHNITSAESLSIGNAYHIDNLDELDKLQTDRIHLVNNPLLSNIDGLDMSSNTLEYVYIRNCPLITNLNCFSNITKITAGLHIQYIDGLTDLYGLHNLETIGTYNIGYGGRFSLEGNENLLGINELKSLNSIIGGITVENNYNLPDLDGLSNITSLQGDITIKWNFYLHNLNGFKNVTSFDGKIHITENPSLRSYCGLQSILTWGIVDDFVVYGNYNNVSEAQILNAPPCD